LASQNGNFVENQHLPGGFKELPQKIYLRNMGTTTINGRNLAAQATILRKEDSGAVTVLQERNGNSTQWNDPPPYNNPAVKYVPISNIGTATNPVYKYGYRADYRDWTKFPNPDPNVFPDWGQ
jgi:hypothetical protein